MGGASAAWAVISGDEAVIPGAVATIGGAGASVPGSGRAKAVLLRGECCHLAGEVLDPLQKCGVHSFWSFQNVGCFRSSSGSTICGLLSFVVGITNMSVYLSFYLQTVHYYTSYLHLYKFLTLGTLCTYRYKFCCPIHKWNLLFHHVSLRCCTESRTVLHCTHS